jgi:hypothetical protein
MGGGKHMGTGSYIKIHTGSYIKIHTCSYIKIHTCCIGHVRGSGGGRE